MAHNHSGMPFTSRERRGTFSLLLTLELRCMRHSMATRTQSAFPSRETKSIWTAIFLIGVFAISVVEAFSSPRISIRYAFRYNSVVKLFEQEPNKNTNDDGEKINEFLDKPFFDPDQVADDDPLPVKWFANLVKNDYNTAEALYAGAVFVVMVILSQELLRMQIYGENYVPFQRGLLPGKLF